MERRALSRLALRPDPPAHELTQALADDQPQAGAAISAGRRGIDLAEDFEETNRPVLPGSAAGGSYPEVNLFPCPPRPPRRYGHPHLAPRPGHVAVCPEVHEGP